MRKPSQIAVVAAAMAALTGCVSARMSDHEPDLLFKAGKYDEAAQKLTASYAKLGENSKDSLLYVLDIGLSLHSAGKYEEAIKQFQKADKLAEIKDYTSIAKESASILTGENAKDYKAEDFENVMISTYLAMDYALLGSQEDAVVEARRVNRKLLLMVAEGGRKYQQNAFARYLSSVLYEDEKDWNNAYIDLKEAQKLEPGFPGLGRDLWRVAWLNGMDEDMERWQSEYNLTAEDKRLARELAPKNKKAEIIVLYENGISPVKVPNPHFRTLPIFKPRWNPVSQAKISIDGHEAGLTQPLYNIESIAIQNLDEKYGTLIARRIGGMVAKEVVADQVGRQTNSPLLGALAKIALYASDQADVRSWSLLPRDLQVARYTVEPGTHTLRMEPSGAGAQFREKTVQVGAGKKVFVNFRYMP